MDRRIIAAAAAVAVGMGTAALAGPYASAVTESGGQVSFRLNESADEVVVIRDGVPTSLGALGQGQHSFSLNSAANYQIVVNKVSGGGYQTPFDQFIGWPTQISDDTNTLLHFDRGVGIAINRNPATPELFGRIYVSAPRDFTTASGRAVQKGIYLINPDHTDALGMGNTALTGGISFDASLATPWSLSLDDDGNLYIADWSNNTGTVWRTGPDVGTSGGVNMLSGLGSAGRIHPTPELNHGSVAGLWVTGSSTAGNLTIYTIDEDLASDPGSTAGVNALWRYDAGSATQGYDGIPTHLNTSLLDVQGVWTKLTGGPDGKLYKIQNRFDGNEAGLYVVAPDGALLYDSLADTIARGYDGHPGLAGTQDLFRMARDVAVSPDGQWMAIATSLAGNTWVVPLIEGIPDMPNALSIDTYPSGQTDVVEFDAAGNMYVISRTHERLRVFSPGGVSQTVYNSDGTFTYRNEPEWDVAGGGNYGDSGNWLLGVVPNDMTSTAKFGGAISGPATVNVGSVTLHSLKFDSGHSYTLSGGQIDLMSFGEPRVTVSGGSHTISSPVVMHGNTQFTVSPADGTLTVDDLTAATTLTVTKAGAGTLAVGNGINADGLDIRGGTARIGAASSVNSLSVAAGSALDVASSQVTVVAGDLDEINALVVSGYAGGAWTGSGINSSSAAAAGDRSLGIGQEGSDVLVKFTYSGDATLDGAVTIADLGVLAANWQGTDKYWFEGDFNYDGSVNIADLGILAGNWQKGTGGGMSFEEALAMFDVFDGVVIPEPSALGLIGLGMLALRRRRVRG
jgi:hypothetical protein